METVEKTTEYHKGASPIYLALSIMPDPHLLYVTCVECNMQNLHHLSVSEIYIYTYVCTDWGHVT